VKIHKNLTNIEIAKLLRAVAASYQIQDESKNKFRIISYSRAADAIEHLGTEAKDIWDEGNLADIPGVGINISKHLGEIFSTGKSKHFEKILRGIPKAALVLMDLPSVGPKRAYRLSQELKLSGKNTLLVLKKYALAGKIAKIPGFGEEIQADILKSIEESKNKPESRLILSVAENIALKIIDWMEKSKTFFRIDVLGSLRRMAPTVGDIDLACATNNPQKTIERFCSYPAKIRVLNKGEKSASLLLSGGIRADLKVEPPSSYGALLQHFTGSKHHNVALREHALKKGMSLSEHGIKTKGKLVLFSVEEDFYKRLGMSFIPPELREDRGEIEAALNHNLPQLIELKDVRGDLQIHSNFDIETSHDIGASSMEEIIFKAKSLNYEYVAFTEHNPSQKGHNPLQILDIIKKKREKVMHVNSSENHVYAFNSLEIDILPDGRLPVSEKALDMLDFALVSIHSSFKKSKGEMTKRVLNALEHPKVKIFAHPTARILGKREAVELDWEKIFEFCLTNNKWIEINADPHRLDLPDFLIREAVGYGVKLTLGTDAHAVDAMGNMRYGVAMARRGWATKEDIVNTLPLKDFLKLL